MRTRVEITDEHREKLLQIAAERGERGCGAVVQEAVAHYLEQRERASQPVLVAPALPRLRADTRAERVRLVIEWIREEVEGVVTGARGFRARLRRSTAPAG
jgi:hypothetical protein